MVNVKASWLFSNPQPSHVMIDGQPVPLIVTDPDTPQPTESPEGYISRPEGSAWDAMLRAKLPLVPITGQTILEKDKGKGRVESTLDWHQIWVEGLKKKHDCEDGPKTDPNAQGEQGDIAKVTSFHHVKSLRTLATLPEKELQKIDDDFGEQDEEWVLVEGTDVEDDWDMVPEVDGWRLLRAEKGEIKTYNQRMTEYLESEKVKREEEEEKKKLRWFS